MNRRQLSYAAIAVAAAASLSACSGLTAAQVTEDMVTYGADIANGVATAVQEMTGLPATVVSAVTAAAQAASTAADSLSTALTITAGQPIAQQIAADVNAVVTDVSGLNIGTQAQNILNDVNMALQVFLPLFAAAGGLFAAPAPNPAGAAALKRLHALPRVALK